MKSDEGLALVKMKYFRSNGQRESEICLLENMNFLTLILEKQWQIIDL